MGWFGHDETREAPPRTISAFLHHIHLHLHTYTSTTSTTTSIINSSITTTTTTISTTISTTTSTSTTTSEGAWGYIADCRESPFLVLTAPDENNSKLRTSVMDASDDNQLWRQESDGRIRNKKSGNYL